MFLCIVLPDYGLETRSKHVALLVCNKYTVMLNRIKYEISGESGFCRHFRVPTRSSLAGVWFGDLVGQVREPKRSDQQL